jgi:hypothetical protein
MGPKQTSPGLSSMAMMILSLTSNKSKGKFHKMGRKMQRNERLRSHTMGMFEREAIDADQIRALVIEEELHRHRR